MEKAIASAIEPVVENIVALEKRFDLLKKEIDSISASNEAQTLEVNIDDVAEHLLKKTEFIEIAKGAKGEPGADASVNFSGLSKKLQTAIIVKRAGEVNV